MLRKNCLFKYVSVFSREHNKNVHDKIASQLIDELNTTTRLEKTIHLLYPEVSWGITDTVSTFIRSVVSPVDLSAFTTLGASWNVYEGLDVIGYFSFQAGEAGDLYGWSKPGWLAASAGLRYIY